MLDNISVGNRITYLRKQNGFTQEELAEKFGITAQAISKWENGHTLPETALLPLLSQLFNCTIDSILMPQTVQEAEFKSFANKIGGKEGGFVLELYRSIKSKIDVAVEYEDKFHVGDEVFNGNSAIFNIPGRKLFILRIDSDKNSPDIVADVRIPLQNCAKYIHVIDKMPNWIKECFRNNDCTCCTSNCTYVMSYTFEGVNYRQCCYITIALISSENIEHILTLLFAEQGI